MASSKWQRTLKRSFELTGIGLHSGRHVSVDVHPAAANTGIVFRLPGGPRTQHEIRAHVEHVDDRKSQLCTQLMAVKNDRKSTIGCPSISTIEHLMAALTASRVTNAYVDVTTAAVAGDDDGDQRHQNMSIELPILDGSSLQFLDAIDQAGIQEQQTHRLRYYRVKKPVQVLMEDKAAWLLPMPEQLGGGGTAKYPTLNMSVQVNFEHKGLGTKFCRYILGDNPDTNMLRFRQEIAPARTFTFEEEIEWMRAHGLALGGSLDNAVVFSKKTPADPTKLQDRVLNPEGLRYPEDEWVRHKMLDCIGDVGLAGKPLHGYFFATSPGHALTHRLLRALFSDASNFEEDEVRQ